MDDSAKIRVSDADKLLIVGEYQAEFPNVENSKDIATRIANKHALKIATVRSILVRAGVYVAQPKPRKIVLDEDKSALIEEYGRATEIERKTFLWQDKIAKKFNYQSIAVGNFFFEIEHERKNPMPVASEPRGGQRSTAAKTRHYADVAAKLSQSTFETRLNGEQGWFANPLWVLNTIVVIFLIALVVTAISSVFG
jgi:glycogen debranching enzyme